MAHPRRLALAEPGLSGCTESQDDNQGASVVSGFGMGGRVTMLIATARAHPRCAMHESLEDVFASTEIHMAETELTS